jgi:hypothetical protein
MIKNLIKIFSSLKNPYFSFLSLFVDYSPVVNKIEWENAYFHELKTLEISKQLKINKLKPQIVSIHNQNLNQSITEKCKKHELHPNIVKINNFIEIFIEKIQWFYRTINVQTIVRNYNVKIQKNSVKLNFANLLFESFPTKLSDRDLIISRKLRITSEIIALEPYTHKSHFERFINWPVLKTPVAKSEFSKNQTDFFREKLASQGKTNKFNINILNIYDKFALGLFASIKQDENTSNIICYFDKNNKKISEDELYYLVIGVKKDSNQLLKSLVSPQEIETVN